MKVFLKLWRKITHLDSPLKRESSLESGAEESEFWGELTWLKFNWALVFILALSGILNVLCDCRLADWAGPQFSWEPVFSWTSSAETPFNIRRWIYLFLTKKRDWTFCGHSPCCIDINQNLNQTLCWHSSYPPCLKFSNYHPTLKNVTLSVNRNPGTPGFQIEVNQA